MPNHVGHYKPGEKVPKSGIYKVVHDGHEADHEVTAVIGEPFPPCRGCGDKAHFVLVRAAHHLKRHKAGVEGRLDIRFLGGGIVHRCPVLIAMFLNQV